MGKLVCPEDVATLLTSFVPMRTSSSGAIIPVDGVTHWLLMTNADSLINYIVMKLSIEQKILQGNQQIAYEENIGLPFAFKYYDANAKWGKKLMEIFPLCYFLLPHLPALVVIL